MRNEEILKRTEEGMKESNKILIRELVRDLEEKGISPVWAIDGEIKKLKVICKSELGNVEAELKQHGLEKSDFCVLEEDSEKTAKSAKALPTKGHNIIIIHKKSARLKKYKTCNNSSWVADLHRDLENKFFTN